MLFSEHIKNTTPTKAQLNRKLWRVQNLYPIRNKKGLLIPFKLNQHQRAVAKQLMKNTLNDDNSPIVILKARQVGISTFFCIWFLDDVLWYEGRRAIIQSQKHETMNDIFSICHTAFRFRYQVGKNRDKDVHEKAGKISVPKCGSFIESKLEVRSMAVNLMHFSEYAFTDLKRITATLGSLTPDCTTVFESTPCGVNHFHDFYYEQKEKNNKNVFFIPWFKHKEYVSPVHESLEPYTAEEIRLKKLYNLSDEQLQFKRQKEQAMNILDAEHKTFQQEYPENDEECFLLSGAGLIDPFILRDLKIQCDKATPLQEFFDEKLKVKIYKRITKEDLEFKIKNNMNYGFYVGVDPAEGVGGDYSACIFIGVDNQFKVEVLATMRGYLNPTQLEEKLKKYIEKDFTYKFHNNVLRPVIVVERNNHGHALIALLKKTKFKNNLYASITDFRRGFVTTRVTKNAILGDIFNVINLKQITMNDPIIAGEFRTLIKNDAGKIEAEQGKHDDMVMALALAYHGYQSRNSYKRRDFKEKVQSEAGEYDDEDDDD